MYCIMAESINLGNLDIDIMGLRFGGNMQLQLMSKMCRHRLIRGTRPLLAGK
jgi:hypothetical protein